MRSLQLISLCALVISSAASECEGDTCFGEVDTSSVMQNKIKVRPNKPGQPRPNKGGEVQSVAFSGSGVAQLVEDQQDKIIPGFSSTFDARKAKTQKAQADTPALVEDEEDAAHEDSDVRLLSQRKQNEKGEFLPGLKISKSVYPVYSSPAKVASAVKSSSSSGSSETKTTFSLPANTVCRMSANKGDCEKCMKAQECVEGKLQNSACQHHTGCMDPSGDSCGKSINDCGGGDSKFTSGECTDPCVCDSWKEDNCGSSKSVAYDKSKCDSGLLLLQQRAEAQDKGEGGNLDESLQEKCI